jgi:hypothetical protein
MTGSTVDATEPAKCGETSANVVWFAVIGTGDPFRVTTCSPNTDFPTQVVVSTDCVADYWSDLCEARLTDDNCTVNTNGASYYWNTEKDVKYDISVGGQQSGQVGNFELKVTQYTLPTNAYCETAEFISLPQGGSVTVSGSTVNAIDTPFCGTPADTVWYAVVGTGKTFTASTCSPNTDFPTQVIVATTSNCYFDRWSDLCEPGLTDPTCTVNAYGAAVTWETILDQKYEIAVSSREAGVEGNFELTVTET